MIIILSVIKVIKNYVLFLLLIVLNFKEDNLVKCIKSFLLVFVFSDFSF